MDAVGRALFSGHALTAAQTFVAGVSRPKKKRLGGMEVRGEERCAPHMVEIRMAECHKHSMGLAGVDPWSFWGSPSG